MLCLFATIACEQQNLQDPDILHQLLRQISAQDRDSLAELYRRTRTAVYAFALSYLKNGQDAEDVTQDTFVRIWENAHRYQRQGHPIRWILAICKNLCLMRLRQQFRTQPLPEEDNHPAFALDCPTLTADDRHVLSIALQVLKDDERRVLFLHVITGLKHREIAALLQIPLPTVLSKYHRALKKLKLMLEGDEPI